MYFLNAVKQLNILTTIYLIEADLVTWLSNLLPVQDPAEVLHFSSLLSSHGYFPIDDHILTVKNDSNSLYRFQTRYFWPSNCWSPENTEYAVYLCKMTMQNKVCSMPEISIQLWNYQGLNLHMHLQDTQKHWSLVGLFFDVK